MAKRKKHLTDEEILERLQKDAPEALEARVDFESVMQQILTSSGQAADRTSPTKSNRRSLERKRPRK
jgi:hypothetical protein